MKNIIKYYYNLDVDTVRQLNDSYYLLINNSYYLLCPFNLEELNEIKKYVKNPYFHTIIYTTNNIEYINLNNTNYILLKINTVSRKIDIKDINNFSNLILYSNNIVEKWKVSWEEHIDYLEYQLSNTNYVKFESIFNYYRGLAENAVQFLNNIKLNNIGLYLAHKRVRVDTNLIDLYNPINIIIDSRVRDLSEYIKSEFFDFDYKINDIYEIIKNNLNIYTNEEKCLLYARLLYPSYFFDMCDDLILGQISQENISNITNKTIEYEKFLREIANEIKKTIYIPNIDWLN